MNTMRLFGMTFLTLLLNFCLSACGKSDDDNNSESKRWDCVFSLNYQDIKVGDTIHVVDRLTKYKLTWRDANGVADVTNTQIIEYDTNIIYYDGQYMNSFDFYSLQVKFVFIYLWIIHIFVKCINILKIIDIII